ncbi:hypothetical protein ABB28_11190 [Stenotrophomonas chelatiphaga]|uniref:Type II secretion system protein H n=2 Tax=Stenotrophomonas chelatiphaga TaxID=517011 RepID=A0A0R0CW59_9GAMM|nr:GspH/FimT family pseudopilin [Stenotrophomonas chelatiphaga]KRG73366.1 hypothetical protein ABB28_11190 [Stenotrophomonas chelatiphaga]ROQ43627.1 type IV fimbrial biogenesis protein FimT [Stenotrophomonas maltophilia]
MQTPYCPASRPTGYGLIELCATLAVVGLLCAVALPSFQYNMARLRADNLRMQLHATLSMARATALTRRKRTHLCPSSDGTTCGTEWADGWLLFEAADKAGKDPHPIVPLMVERRAPSTVRVLHTQHRLRVQFRHDGRNAGRNLSLYICAGDRLHSEIKVSITGRVRSNVLRRSLRCAVP